MSSLPLQLIHKLAPIYSLVLFGFMVGRRLQLETSSFAKLLIYLLSPVVAFFSLLELNLSVSRLSLPLLFFLLCSFIGLSVFYYAKKRAKITGAGILAYASGSGNSGFFGFPLVVSVLGSDALGLAVLASLGFVAYENSIGFFLASRAAHSWRQALRKVLSLPTLYASVLAISLNLLGLRTTNWAGPLPSYFRGTYIVLGMMLLGIALASQSGWRNSSSHRPYLVVGLMAKFAVWPILVFFLLHSSAFASWYDPTTRKVIQLMSIVPHPILSVAVASLFGTATRETALLVLVSTLASILFIPLFLNAFALA